MRTRLAAFLAIVLGIAVLNVAFSLAQAVAAPALVHRQVITVQVPSASSTTGTLDLWQMGSDGVYRHQWVTVRAYVGERGVGKTADNIARTPAGVFGLTQAFGNQPTNGTKLPYFRASRSDWWSGETSSAAYNTHVHQSRSPGPNSENLYDAGAVYAHAVVIDYNMSPVVKGAGSAFFLHVTNGQPTAGCVAILGSQLNAIMRWLDPRLHPVISIGVGSAAKAIISTNNAAVARHNPSGRLDSAVAAGGGRVTVGGWAVDPDNRSAVVRIHIYSDGRVIRAATTGVARPDVARAVRAGPTQGYRASVTLTPGRHRICTFAINIATGTQNPLLGCKLVTVR
jgi:L,D-peptidoglycan transpeptidase YkuD (ErfK/YbiS/YcfS/YnhG family)